MQNPRTFISTAYPYVAQKIKTKKSNVKSLHPNSPLSNVNSGHVIEALKLERKENKELRKRLAKEIQLKCC